MSDTEERVQRAVRRRVRKVKANPDIDPLGSVESRPDVGPQRPDVGPQRPDVGPQRPGNPSETTGLELTDDSIVWPFMIIALAATGVFISSGDTDDQWYDSERAEWQLPISLITIVWIGVILLIAYSGSRVYTSLSGNIRHYANLLFAIALIMSLVWSVAFSARNLDLAFMALLIGIGSVFGWWYLARNSSQSSTAIVYIVWSVYLLALTKDLLDRREM